MGLLNYEIDLHGLTADVAKKRLERLLVDLPDKYGQITVIHGYQQGDRLACMVRSKTFSPKRIRRKIRTMNPGETILLLHEKTKQTGSAPKPPAKK